MNRAVRDVELVLLAGAVLLIALLVPRTAAASPPTIWCSTPLVADSEKDPGVTMAAYQRARRELCAGDFAAARAGFAAILPTMRTGHQTDGTNWIDFGRSYFYALLATGDANGARTFLTSFENTWKATSAERFFWNEDYPDSFAAYVADDGRVLRDPDQQAEHKFNPLLTAALQAVRAGNLDDAIADMKADPDTGSLYSLMLGNLYAQKRTWPQAFTAWVAAAAAGPGFPQPEWYSLDEWNVSALEMIYYYRAHAPH
jgi:hypothetical protein